MTVLASEQLQAYRRQTFRIQPGQRLASPDEAVHFVNERGYVFFWPIKGVPFPNLWTAAAGDRPVADEHDDPGHVTWGWKDSMLGKKRWYYGRVLRTRNAMVSLETAPYFYALTENYGSPEEDYLLQYEQGHLTQEAKLVYEALLDSGPMDTLALRRAAHLTSRESDGRFNKAVNLLQADFKILPVGVAEVGAWKYAFIYDITARHMPELPEQARLISEKDARKKLVELYFQSMGAGQVSDVTHLLALKSDQVTASIQILVEAGQLARGIEVEGKPGEWFALNSLL
jgi:hypothetical protein